MIGPAFGRAMKVGDCRRQRRHDFEAERTGCCQPIEQVLLREAIHHHEPVDGAAIAPDRIGAITLPGDGDDAAIERRCRSLIEANFRLAQTPAPLGRGKVEIVETDGPLQFVSPCPCEEDDRRVGVDSLNGCTAVRGWGRQEVDDRGLVLGSHGRQDVARETEATADVPV